MKNPSVCSYVFTDPCLKAGAFMFIGIGIGTLVALSANNPDKFMEIVKYPLSEDIQFSMAATVGIAILGMIVLYNLINYAKYKCRKEEPIETLTYGRMYSAPVATPSATPYINYQMINERNAIKADSPPLVTTSPASSLENPQEDAPFVLIKKGSSPDSSDSDIPDPLQDEVRIPEDNYQGMSLS